MGLNATLVLFVCELLLFGFCYWKDRQPINIAKPRMLPYRFIMLVLVIVLLATLAHIIALVTGIPVVARRKTGM